MKSWETIWTYNFIFGQWALRPASSSSLWCSSRLGIGLRCVMNPSLSVDAGRGSHGLILLSIRYLRRIDPFIDQKMKLSFFSVR